MSGDTSETDLDSEAGSPRARAGATEEKARSRWFEFAAGMREKEASSGDDPESEPKTESENQKESLSSEDNSQGVQEELKKVRAAGPPATARPLRRGPGTALRSQRCAGFITHAHLLGVCSSFFPQLGATLSHQIPLRGHASVGGGHILTGCRGIAGAPYVS